MKAIAEDKPYRVPATIDDPAILAEVEAALQRMGYARNPS
jgi:propionyl-CoA synthetase